MLYNCISLLQQDIFFKWMTLAQEWKANDLPSRLRRISSGETGRSFLSAFISSNILSWRLRGRGGVGFSFLAEALGVGVGTNNSSLLETLVSFT